MVSPEWQVGKFVHSGFLYWPTPRLKELCQVHPYSLGKCFCIQVHLFLFAIGKVAHLVISSKHLLEGIPSKLILELIKKKNAQNIILWHDVMKNIYIIILLLSGPTQNLVQVQTPDKLVWWKSIKNMCQRNCEGMRTRMVGGTNTGSSVRSPHHSRGGV